jgi:hypothetical protein
MGRSIINEEEKLNLLASIEFGSTDHIFGGKLHITAFNVV